MTTATLPRPDFNIHRDIPTTDQGTPYPRRTPACRTGRRDRGPYRKGRQLGTLDRKQAGSLAGLVPHSRESGQWKGKSFISGGRKPLRDALYMPALVAMRFNLDLKEKCHALREAGKPAKLAIVVLMRKLLEMANALVKADRVWVEKRP